MAKGKTQFRQIKSIGGKGMQTRERKTRNPYPDMDPYNKRKKK